MKISSIALVCSGFLALSAQAGVAVAEGEAVPALDTESRALLQREISNRMAKVRSAGELQAYIASARGAPTPLDLLSPGAKRRFIDSLAFTPNGLGSFTYADIRSELTLSEAYQLLSLFGREATAASIRGIRIESEEDQMISQMSVGIRNADYMDYWCRTTSTCTRKLEDICVAPGC